MDPATYDNTVTFVMFPKSISVAAVKFLTGSTSKLNLPLPLGKNPLYKKKLIKIFRIYVYA